jgi:hypothetical protein
MNLHLAEIAQAIAADAHAVLLMDQAGWHMTDRLIVPENISIVPLPAKCPELNPVENVWQFMRQSTLRPDPCPLASAALPGSQRFNVRQCGRLTGHVAR